jgi:hypothetical protein
MNMPFLIKDYPTTICQRYEPSETVRPFIRPGVSAEEFLKLLDAHQLFADALHFTAYGLPSREAIWWGSLCIWTIYRPKPREKEKEVTAVFNAVIAWIQEPTEETRRAAEATIEPAGMDTPAGGLAMALFYTGTNIAPPKLPEVKPKPFLWSKLLDNAVSLAVKKAPPDKKKECERQFLIQALEVAQSVTRWDPDRLMGESIIRLNRR